jgi:hypothetical protein
LILLALVALAQAPAPVAPAEPEDTFLCQTDTRIDADTSGLMNLSVDAAGHVLNNEFNLSGNGYEAAWRPGPGLLAGPGAMTEFSYFLDSPPETRYPVTLVATADGRPFWTGQMDAPNLNNGNNDGSARPMLLIGTDTDPAFPNLFGVRRLDVVARDARGATVATGTLQLPDWWRVERGVRYAMRHNEQSRRAHQCPLDEPVI